MFKNHYNSGAPVLFLSGGPGAPPGYYNPIIDYKISHIIISKQYYDPSLVTTLLKYGPLNTKINQLMIQHLFDINWDVEEKLKKLSVPAIIINGKYDPIGDQPVIDLEKTLKNSKLHLIDHCRHYVWFEKPNELQNILTQFLKEL